MTHTPQHTPWATLLCKFRDDDSEPRPRDFYERLFTTAGTGTMNMTDYFHTMSHGAVDLTGSRVLGWYTLPYKRSEYTGSGPNWAGRQALIDWAKQAAADAGDDLSPFYGVVVTTNVPTDLFGGGGRQAVCDNLSLLPSVLGQEMGHGFGLDHSREQGSADDYRDRWDTMSTWNSCFIASHPDYQQIGPGLNAANMRGRGWLDEGRVWRAGSGSYSTSVTLRPLHDRHLPGWLAAELPGGQLLEFRMDDGWDAAIPKPAVLVHTFQDNHSYIWRGANGQQDLGPGDALEIGTSLFILSARTQVTVESIDPGARMATIRVSHQEPYRLPELVGTVLGGVSVDGGGWIIVGGKIHKVPPRGPLVRILELLALYQSTDLNQIQMESRNAIRREVLTSISAEIEALQEEALPFHTPAAQEEKRQR